MSKYWDTGFYSQPTAAEIKKNSAASRKREEKKGKSLEEGSQPICDHMTYGKSITDPCLGWDDTRRLIDTIAEMSV